MVSSVFLLFGLHNFLVNLVAFHMPGSDHRRLGVYHFPGDRFLLFFLFHSSSSFFSIFFPIAAISFRKAFPISFPSNCPISPKGLRSGLAPAGPAAEKPDHIPDGPPTFRIGPGSASPARSTAAESQIPALDGAAEIGSPAVDR